MEGLEINFCGQYTLILFELFNIILGYIKTQNGIKLPGPYLK